jgi:hypothetical protein
MMDSDTSIIVLMQSVENLQKYISELASVSCQHMIMIEKQIKKLDERIRQLELYKKDEVNKIDYVG